MTEQKYFHIYISDVTSVGVHRFALCMAYQLDNNSLEPLFYLYYFDYYFIEAVLVASPHHLCKFPFHNVSSKILFTCKSLNLQSMRSNQKWQPQSKKIKQEKKKEVMIWNKYQSHALNIA